MVSLRQFETDQSGSFGNATHPANLAGKEALKVARMAKAVDLVVQHPAPTVVVLSEQLGVSRATVYRLLADSGFQVLLRKALEGRIALVAKRAMDQVEKALDEGSPALRFKAATWLLERQQKLERLANPTDREFEQQKREARFQELMNHLRERNGKPPVQYQPPGDIDPSIGSAAALAVQQQRQDAEDLGDAELLDDSDQAV